MYFLVKTIHVLSVALFLGNIITGIFWKAHADATGDPRLQAHALAGIIRSDNWFTLPSVLAIIASGVVLASMAGLHLLRTDWISVSLILFGLSGLLFVVFVAPAQKKLLAIANAATAGTEWPSADYHRVTRTWELAGLLSIALPLGALALMVFRPADVF
jgi:uncharacterized membrane protein